MSDWNVPTWLMCSPPPPPPTHTQPVGEAHVSSCIMHVANSLVSTDIFYHVAYRSVVVIYIYTPVYSLLLQEKMNTLFNNTAVSFLGGVSTIQTLKLLPW